MERMLHPPPAFDRSSRKEMKAALARHLHEVIRVFEASLLQRGFAPDDIALNRTKDFLRTLESGATHQDLAELLHSFQATVLDHECFILGLEQHGLLPPETTTQIEDLVQRLYYSAPGA